MGWISPFLDLVLIILGFFVIILIVFALSMYKRIAALLTAKAMNELRIYVDETGKEAYAFAKSMHPDAGQAERLERAVEYMQRQFAGRSVHFDYEHARA